jgi:hypothetical protein
LRQFFQQLLRVGLQCGAVGVELGAKLHRRDMARRESSSPSKRARQRRIPPRCTAQSHTSARECRPLARTRA